MPTTKDLIAQNMMQAIDNLAQFVGQRIPEDKKAEQMKIVKQIIDDVDTLRKNGKIEGPLSAGDNWKVTLVTAGEFGATSQSNFPKNLIAQNIAQVVDNSFGPQKITADEKVEQMKFFNQIIDDVRTLRKNGKIEGTLSAGDEWKLALVTAAELQLLREKRASEERGLEKGAKIEQQPPEEFAKSMPKASNDRNRPSGLSEQGFTPDASGTSAVKGTIGRK